MTKKIYSEYGIDKQYVFMAKKVYLSLHWDENGESTILFKLVCISV